MNKLTAEKCRAAIESIKLRQQSIREEIYLQALEIALPVLEQKTHKSVIAEQLEAVKESLDLNPHQNAIISCAIDRLNELNVRVVELSRSLFEQPPSTTPQIDNDGWVDWGGGECPVNVRTMVEVRWCDGSNNSNMAGCWRWRHDCALSNIIAYRVIESGGEL
ncbi:hypothetical protein PUG46_19435 [Erwiniaceae bacterium L1_55_4]|nr:hypothetical protein [Erwiniaceae bacterium L1_55_4]